MTVSDREHSFYHRHLISTEADVNQSNGIKTPFIVACEKEDITVVKHLIKAGVDIKALETNPHL